MPDAYEVGDHGFVVRRPDGESIQAAVDAACGGGDPATVARRASGPVYLPPGMYRVTKPIRIASVAFLDFRGAGYASKLFPDGEMPSVLDLNGVAFSTFSDFMIEGDRRESVTDAIRYYWEPATSGRSSFGNVFRRILVQDVRCEVGLRIGLPGSTAQTDTTSYENLTFGGAWTPGEKKWWQAGVVVGTGAHGNNIIHSFWNPGVTRWRSGFKVDATHFLLCGGSLGANDVDFACESLSYFSVQGVRCEESRRLLTNGSGATEAPAAFSLADIVVGTTKLDPDGGLIKWLGYNGNLSIRNLYVGVWATGARIIAQPWMGLTLSLDGVTCASTLDGFLSGLSPKVDANVRGFTTLKPDGSGWGSASRGLVSNAPVTWPGGGAVWAEDAGVCWKREQTGDEAMLAEVDLGPPPAARGPVKFPDGGRLETAPDGRLVWTSKGGRRTVLARV